MKDYAAAIVTFLNREDETERAYMYPITRIELKNAEAITQKVFIVQDGKWEEE